MVNSAISLFHLFYPTFKWLNILWMFKKFLYGPVVVLNGATMSRWLILCYLILKQAANFVGLLLWIKNADSKKDLRYSLQTYKTIPNRKGGLFCTIFAF